jgi:hypothetical protein
MPHELKHFGVGLAGGVLGAGVVAAALGAVGYYQWTRMGAFLPTVLEFTTDQNSKFYAYAYLSCKQGSKRARIVIPPFALTTMGPTKAAVSAPMLGGGIPVSLSPVDKAPSKAVHMYSKDTKHFTTGTAAISAYGVVTISTDAPSGSGEAWGLARELVLEYPVA